MRAAVEAHAAARLGRCDVLGSVADVRGVLDAADVLVLASRTEGVPGIAIQAALTGVAVAAYDVGGVGEVVVDGATGRLVPAEDRHELQAAMVDLVDAPPDAGIAHAWVAGRGFVNPVMLSFTLEGATPPLPGFATRAPLLPVLLAIPISLGASLHTLGIVHQAWAALVVGALFLVAARSMSLAAAAACAVTFAWSTGWLVVSRVRPRP